MCCSERRRDVTVAIASWSILAAASFNSLSGLAFAQDTLYAAGSLYVPGSQSPLALGRLIQTNWVSVGGGVGDGLSVFGIASDGTNLFVTGSFRTVDSIPADGLRFGTAHTGSRRWQSRVVGWKSRP